MKTTIVCLVCLCALGCFGQSQSDSFDARVDSQPTLTEPEMERIYHRLERLDREGRLSVGDRPSDNRFVRALDHIFRPEAIRIGNTYFSCSVITAVKRKNPLCLLNPLVVSVSW